MYGLAPGRYLVLFCLSAGLIPCLLHVAFCVREMGLFAAKCMVDSVDELSAGAFDLFVHATRFFDHKVRSPYVITEAL